MAKKYRHSLGFIGTGAVARTFLARLESLEGWLGPVYSPSKRATPRLVTALGAGFPVQTWEAMQHCRYLLVCAPPAETTVLLEEALAGDVLRKVEVMALIGPSADCEPGQVVRAAVGDTGCLTRLPVRTEATYLVEGSLRFRRFCQRLTRAPLRRLVQTRRESRAMVESAVFMAEEFCLPLFEAIQHCIMLAGVSADHARELSAELMQESVGNALFAGRKRWTGILHREDRGKLQEIIRALQQENELLANLVLNYAQHGLASMGKRTDWLTEGEAQKNVHAPGTLPDCDDLDGYQI